MIAISVCYWLRCRRYVVLVVHYIIRSFHFVLIPPATHYSYVNNCVACALPATSLKGRFLTTISCPCSSITTIVTVSISSCVVVIVLSSCGVVIRLSCVLRWRLLLLLILLHWLIGLCSGLGLRWLLFCCWLLGIRCWLLLGFAAGLWLSFCACTCARTCCIGLRVGDGLLHHGLFIVYAVFKEEVSGQFFILIAGQVCLQTSMFREAQAF